MPMPCAAALACVPTGGRRPLPVYRLAEFQHLIDDGVQRAVFRITIDIANEKSKDRLCRRALEMLLQGDDRFLLKEDRIERAAGGTASGARGPRRGRRIPQDRPIQRHRLGFRLDPVAHASVSKMMPAARSTSARVTSRWVTARSRRGPNGTNRTPACVSRVVTPSEVSRSRRRSTIMMLVSGTEGWIAGR